MKAGFKSGLWWSSLAGISSVTLGPLFLGSAPILAIGIIFGPSWSQISVAIGAATVILLSSGDAALLFLFVTAIPAALAIQYASIPDPRRNLEGLSRSISALALFGLFAIVLLGADLFGLGQRIESHVERTFSQFFSHIQNQIQTVDSDQVKQIKTALNRIASFASYIAIGGISAAAFLILTSNFVLVVAILKRTNFSYLDYPDYRTIQPPRWLSIVFFVSILMALLDGSIGKIALNCAIFLTIPFLFTGLAVIHSLAKRHVNYRAVLVGFYFSIFVFGFVFGLLSVISALLALLGAMEIWVGIRRRFGVSS